MNTEFKNKYCIVCNKRVKNVFTCSPKCAGVLAYSSRQANFLRKEFNKEPKNKIRKFLFDKYIKPSVFCVKPNTRCFNILDFWGGGLFSDYIVNTINHNKTVNNQNIRVTLYEIDSNKDLHPSLKKYTIEKNSIAGMCKTKAPLKVIPFCGSLTKFIQGFIVKNQRSLDFIWLDYCGTIGNVEDDLEKIREVCSFKTVIGITIFRHRDGAISGEIRKTALNSIVTKNFPRHKLVKEFLYESMGTFIYKVPSKLQRMFI